jgi:hypothetical protein
MGEVPAAYLDWFDGQPWSRNWPEVKEYVQRHRAQLNLEIDEERERRGGR